MTHENRRSATRHDSRIFLFLTLGSMWCIHLVDTVNWLEQYVQPSYVRVSWHTFIKFLLLNHELYYFKATRNKEMQTDKTQGSLAIWKAALHLRYKLLCNTVRTAVTRQTTIRNQLD